MGPVVNSGMEDEDTVSNGNDFDASGYSRYSEEQSDSTDVSVNSSAREDADVYENDSNSSIHLPVTEIHLKSHEWFGSLITKHELPRKAFHSSIGFVTLYLYKHNIDYKKVAWPLIVAFLVIGSLDVVRLRVRWINHLYCRCVGALMRKKEINTYNGVLWYLLGLIFSFSFFSKDIALISLFLLSWCDTAASTFGRKYGHLTPKLAKNKSLAGSLAACVTGIIVCAVFYGYYVPAYAHVNKPGEILWSPATSRLSLLQISLLGGVVAALSEGIDLFNWDDNFTIPVLSAIFMRVMIAVFAITPAANQQGNN
ncbi:HDL516Wp [Eremothecium sinecaudum]|uniref:HDL516Wp n=1 Tax=Eremothecium sinecaudum TaxID=45286 RepID=A0A0X8HRR8_9SACH|nr:HDL516Wp [Eremothecium sinecaudum]AMD20228.1 HDL516Wp [Eremothecium sinecaudum]